MTKNKLHTWMISRVIIAILVLVSVLLLPVTVFAESEEAAGNVGATSSAAEGSSPFASSETASSDFTGLGQSSDPGITDPAGATPPQEPPVLNETPPQDTPLETSPESGNQNSGSGSPEAPETGSPAEGEAACLGGGNSYVASITPDAVAVPGSGGSNQIPDGYGGLTGGTAGNFTITFTEVGDKTIGSAQVTIPGTFTDLSFDLSSIAAPSGKNWSGGLVGHVLSLWALNSASYLDGGESVSATVTATTPTATDQHEFATSAWTDANASFNGIGSTVNNRATGYSDPVVIVGLSVSTADELNAIRGGLGLYGDYVQTGDINLSGYTNWEPIGTNFNQFNGSYNGNGFKISNLTINRPDADFIGLFGRVGSSIYDAVLSNIHLENVNVTGRDRVGGLVGYGRGTISNIYASVSVNGNNNVGGLVGSSDACTVTNSYASGFVTGNDYVGGLVGLNYEGRVVDSYASGFVTGNDNVGSLVGYNYRGGVTDSYASGSVTGCNFVGGLVGNVDSGGVTDSYATGSVNGTTNHVGGLVGSNKGTITNSYASGSVTGYDNVGGLVGLNNSGMVTDSCATGSVTGNDNVGGLVGNQYFGTITSCYAAGAVIGFSDVGGLVGLFNGTVTDSYATGSVTGTANVGGLVGYHYGGTVTDSFWDTTTSGQSASAGGTGKTMAQMKQLATFGAWDISDQGGEDTVWRIYETSTYPLLRHFFADTAIITVSADSRDYDGTTVLTGGSYQLEDGKNPSWVHKGTVSYQASSKNAGNAEVILLGVYSNQKEYDLIFVPSGSTTINPRPITVTAVTDTKVYDGKTNSSGEPDISSGSLVTGDSANWTQTFDNRNAGTGKTITPAGTVNDGNGGNNYAVTFEPVLTGVITAKPITIAPDSGQSKIIGAADPVFTYQHTALIGDDQITGELGRVAGEDLGNYAYNLGSLSAGSNYNLLLTDHLAPFTIVEQPVDPDPDPDPDPTPGPDDPSPGDSDPENQFFIPALVPAPFAGVGLTSIPGQAANAIITPAFVTGGSSADLGLAIAAYNQTKQSYEANKGTMSDTERAVAEVELATANAAIIALQLSLAAQSSQAVNVAALVAAYQAAQSALESNRGLLSADQIAAAEALLNAIASVISSLST